MSLSSEQAAQALREVEQTSALSSTLYGYQQASPYLILWGVIWVIKFALGDFFPQYNNFIWIPFDVLGVAGCFYLGARSARARQCSGVQKVNDGWRWLGSIAAVMAFIVVIQLIMAPVTERQAVTFIVLIVAVAYVLYGLWGSPRIGVTGVVLAALILFGYYQVQVHFDLWTGVVGGGSLILAGLWLKKA